ncbi:MAG: C25 family cysteine peptidase [Ardenticatenales bacterium]
MMLPLVQSCAGTVRHLTTRRRAASAVPRPTAAALIVTSRHRLWQRYGPEGIFAIEDGVRALTAAMDRRGLTGTLVYADGSPLLTALGVLPAAPSEPDGVARVVRDVARRMVWTEEAARFVLILGDDGIVPFHRLPNPTDDDDAVVLSDHPYGLDTPAGDGGSPRGPRADEPSSFGARSLDAASLAPSRAVGRMPDASLPALLAALAAAAAAHDRLAEGAPLLLSDGAFGYSASVWKRAARGAFSAVGEPQNLRLSPPLSFQDRPQPGPNGPRYRYYNLHGLSDGPDWYGQVDPTFPAGYEHYPVALRPVDIDPAPGAVVFAEACHGAPTRVGSPGGAMAMAHLAGGCLAYVGATGVAYGGLDGGLVAADLLAHRFWRALLGGLPAGEALAVAKAALIGEGLARQRYLDAEDVKAIHNFVLYGDPSLVHAPSREAARMDGAGAAAEMFGPAATVGLLPVRPPLYDAYGGPPYGESPASPYERPHGASSARSADSSARVAVDRLKHDDTRPAWRTAGGRCPDGSLACALSPAALIDSVRRSVARRLPAFAEGDVRIDLHPVCAPPHQAHGPHDGNGNGDGDGDPEDGARRGMIVTLARSIPTAAGPDCRSVLHVTVDGEGAIRRLAVSR